MFALAIPSTRLISSSISDVHVAVNARYTYYGTDGPIPGGVAFENFELRERFHPGQPFIFGISRKTPAELGLRPVECPSR